MPSADSTWKLYPGPAGLLSHTFVQQFISIAKYTENAAKLSESKILTE